MINLLTETKAALSDNSKRPGDVEWVGSADGLLALDWNTFATIADFKYDDGFGSQVIAKDLVVVGNGWWLERHEYDGSEGWSFKTMPARTTDAKAFSLLQGCWSSLGDITTDGAS